MTDPALVNEVRACSEIKLLIAVFGHASGVFLVCVFVFCCFVLFLGFFEGLRLDEMLHTFSRENA